MTKKSSESKYTNHYSDERAINSSGAYNFDEFKNDEEYPDDFEDATRNTGELEDVLDNYKRVLSGDITLPGEMSLKKASGSFSAISEVSSDQEIDPGTLSKLRDSKEKKIIMDCLGEDLYDEIYSYLKEAREKEVDDRVIQAQMKYFVGEKNKDALSM